jgi:hypothetical protein
MKVLATERQEGKTTELLRWVLGGHAISVWPSWSRVIIVDTKREALHLTENHPAGIAIDGLIKQKGGPGLRKLVLVYEQDQFAIQSRLHLAGVEVAVDNADRILHRLLHQMPAFVTLTGEVAKTNARYATSPYIDTRGVEHVWSSDDADWHHVKGPSDCGDPTCPDFTGSRRGR